MDLTQITFDAWMEIGLVRGFVGPPVCSTHDGIPMTTDEEHEFEEGFDPCIHVIRPYESAEQRENIERNHPATIFRNPLRSPGDGSMS